MEDKTFEWEIRTEVEKTVVKTPEEAKKALDKAGEAMHATPAYKAYKEAERVVYATPEYKAYIEAYTAYLKAVNAKDEARKELNNGK